MPRDPRLYLEEILESIKRIQEYTVGMASEQFLADRKTADAVVRNLEIIGEASRALPDSFHTMAPEIEWRKIIGMRNVIAHAYFGVSLVVVWDIVVDKLPALERATQKLLDHANAEPPSLTQ